MRAISFAKEFNFLARYLGEKDRAVGERARGIIDAIDLAPMISRNRKVKLVEARVEVANYVDSPDGYENI